MKNETWRKFLLAYEKEEGKYRSKYMYRYAPPDGVNKRYKVVDMDIDKSFVVDNERVAYEIFSETLRRNHQAQLYEI